MEQAWTPTLYKHENSKFGHPNTMSKLLTTLYYFHYVQPLTHSAFVWGSDPLQQGGYADFFGTQTQWVLRGVF